MVWKLLGIRIVSFTLKATKLPLFCVGQRLAFFNYPNENHESFTNFPSWCTIAKLVVWLQSQAQHTAFCLAEKWISSEHSNPIRLAWPWQTHRRPAQCFSTEQENYIVKINLLPTSTFDFLGSDNHLWTLFSFALLVMNKRPLYLFPSDRVSKTRKHRKYAWGNFGLLGKCWAETFTVLLNFPICHKSLIFKTQIVHI